MPSGKMHFKTFCCLCMLYAGLVSTPLQAEVVTVDHRGLTLNANLEIAPGKKHSDTTILITHGGLAHRGMELIAYLQSLFKEKGFNTLAINLSLGVDNRHGMYDCSQIHRHRHGDAVEEIGAWLKWFYKKGGRRVILLGHSRGGGQTALYASQYEDYKAVVLMAPQTKANGGAGYEKRYKQSLTPVLVKARELVQQGQSAMVLNHVNMMFCRDTAATAASFLSYYGADPTLDTPSLLPKINKPTLVVVAEDDQVVSALEEKIAPFVDGKRVRKKVITNAGHFFRDLNADEVVDAVAAFVEQL